MAAQMLKVSLMRFYSVAKWRASGCMALFSRRSNRLYRLEPRPGFLQMSGGGRLKPAECLLECPLVGADRKRPAPHRRVANDPGGISVDLDRQQPAQRSRRL